MQLCFTEVEQFLLLTSGKTTCNRNVSQWLWDLFTGYSLGFSIVRRVRENNG